MDTPSPDSPRLLDHLSVVSDPRSRCLHPLSEILVIAILGVLRGLAPPSRPPSTPLRGDPDRRSGLRETAETLSPSSLSVTVDVDRASGGGTIDGSTVRGEAQLDAASAVVVSKGQRGAEGTGQNGGVQHDSSLLLAHGSSACS